MCELPQRHLRDILKPGRLITALLGVILAAGAWLIPRSFSSLPIGVGGLLVLGAAIPALRDWEVQLPGIKLSGSFEERRGDIFNVFEHQRGELQLCAQMLCRDPEQARSLLEAALAQSAEAWRGPVTPQLRIYTLCLFVKLVEANEKWASPPPRHPKTPLDPLHALPFQERVAVVLHDFGHLSIAEIAGLTDSTLAAVTERLGLANQMALGGGQP
jgi:hypothetical protein